MMPQPKVCKEKDDSKFFYNISVTLERGKMKIDKDNSVKKNCSRLKEKIEKNPQKKEKICEENLIVGAAWDNCDVTCGYCTV